MWAAIIFAGFGFCFATLWIAERLRSNRLDYELHHRSLMVADVLSTWNHYNHTRGTTENGPAYQSFLSRLRTLETEHFQ